MKMNTWKLKNDFDGGFFIDVEAFYKLYQNGGLKKLPKCQLLVSDFPELIAKAPQNYVNRYFISHRWDRKNSPDVRGWQLDALKSFASELIAKRKTPACFWYDYCSLPQSPRTTTESAFFKEGLKNINYLCRTCTNICLVSNTTNDPTKNITLMIKRGWILVELFVASHHEKTYLSLFEGSHDYITEAKLNRVKWDGVIPDLASLIPFYDAKFIRKWFVLNDIKCTNGSDLKVVAGLLSHHIFNYIKEIKRAKVTHKFRNNNTINLTTSQVAACYINKFGLSPLYPKKYFETIHDPISKTFNVKAMERPSLPTLNKWKSLSKKQFSKYKIDTTKNNSPLYPGISFEFRQTKKSIVIRPSLIKVKW